jgi:hypothetical protein
MDHIPVFKRGEVLLKRRFGQLEPSAPPSASQLSFDSLFESGVSSAHA